MHRFVITVGVAIAALASAAAAQDGGSASNLDELLRMVQEGRARGEQEYRGREQRFRAALDEQQQVLADAKRRVASR